MSRGGKRPGAGRPALDIPTVTHGIRCTDAGWRWLKAQAKTAGHGSVGKWADAKGQRKAKDTPASE